MPENLLIPLPDLDLPPDFPWRVGFVGLVNEQLRRLRATGYFIPPRFFGYYFQAGAPVGVGGCWTVTLDAVQPASLLPRMVERLTLGAYPIASLLRDRFPDYLLVHDRQDGACWLWTFTEGLRFVEAVEPTLGDDGYDSAEKPRLLGP
jgi:hypothetical protein